MNARSDVGLRAVCEDRGVQDERGKERVEGEVAELGEGDVEVGAFAEILGRGGGVDEAEARPVGTNDHCRVEWRIALQAGDGHEGAISLVGTDGADEAEGNFT